MNIGLIIGAFFLGVFVVLFLITIHELGHFLVAKISGAYVYEFAIGFGPRIFTFKGKETWVSIRIFPLGGYVYIASDHADPPKGREDEEIPDNRKMEYLARWKKAFFMIAGPLMNLFLAVILVTTIFMITLQKPNDMDFYGQKLVKDQIAYKLIDKHLKEKKKVNDGIGEDLQKYAILGWEICLNSNESEKIEITPNKKKGGKAPTYKSIVYSFLDKFSKFAEDKEYNQEESKIRFYYAPIDKYTSVIDDEPSWTEFSSTKHWKFEGKKTTVGIMAPTRYFKNTTQAYGYGWKEVGNSSVALLKAFGALFSGNIKQLAGPIGIANQTAEMMKSADTFFLYVAGISANLFMLNLIPIPPLDGYKFLENAVEAVIRKEINRKAKYVIYAVGAFLFLALFITITIKDIIWG